ncbi:hypothetical protein GCM10011499_27390 [Pelagibacterium lentulum]|uniref:Cell wall hydrolase SleB domain-containing protein n=1 Tax=Pelagibacterium lentulum TaxID=2029865 RepID=A0A916VZM8_9HYPH|nr:hypothetical protein GCM10011499_27390 [Pelagibacterium lentulum]
MAYRSHPVRSRKGRASTVLARAMAGLTLSVCAWAALVGETGGYRALDPASEIPAVPIAALHFEANEPVITGSVSSLFDAPIFSGPNRTDKTGRARPETDIVTFAQSFDAVRLSIAERRANGDPLTTMQSDVMVADAASGGAEDGPRISVASVNTNFAGVEGLRAIDALSAPDADPSIPRPASVPDTLAYARANTPETDFTPQHQYSEREQWCLATGIYFEARGESYRGQVAVAQVIMNRVEHQNYPNTICGVVYQNQHRRNACQFSFACDGKTNVNRTPEVAAWARAQEITQTVLNGEIYLTEVADATHYHATYVRPAWARNMDRLTQIGMHIFYRFKPGWRFGSVEGDWTSSNG